MIYYQIIKDIEYLEGISDIKIDNSEELDVRSPLFLTLKDTEEYLEALNRTTDFSDDFEWQYFEYQIIKLTVPYKHKISSEWTIKERI